MKKLLIIQQDEGYFLFETIQVLEKNFTFFKDISLTILVKESSLNEVYDHSHPIISGITSDEASVLNSQFDTSVNLSLNEESWRLHAKIKSHVKIGPHIYQDETKVSDLWSSYLLTLKAKAPFLTFHLQDVYKNILGLKNFQILERTKFNLKQIAFSTPSTQLLSADEQELLIDELARKYPEIILKDISEIDLVSDLSQTLFLGPTSLDALKICEAGGTGIFLSSNFQGFNLLPHTSGHVLVSSRNYRMTAKELLKLIESFLNENKAIVSPYSIYQIEHDHMFGAYLKNLNETDDNYPFYQSHVVLWNFLLSLHDINLDIVNCNKNQINLLKSHQEVLRKFLRLHDYAMVSVDTVYHQAKSKNSQADIIEGHLKNLRDIDKISDQIAQSHSFFRPILDFYRIRKGQNDGRTLSEQAQHSFLNYSEEHQALEALLELFSMTLKQNEASI